jgi:hypothetical protein
MSSNNNIPPAREKAVFFLKSRMSFEIYKSASRNPTRKYWIKEYRVRILTGNKYWITGKKEINTTSNNRLGSFGIIKILLNRGAII